jgi:hypothetical protein
MIVAGATSTGGLAALAVNKFRSDTSPKADVTVSKMEENQQRRTRHEQEHV